MEKGKLLGKGMTAEVYKWGDDKVLKLYFNQFPKEFVRAEAATTQKIHDAGVDAPEVFGVVEIDGRNGIIFERIPGKTMTSILFGQPFMFFNFAQHIADLQYKIHQCSAEGIPTQNERFEHTVKRSSKILGDKVNKILDYVDTLPKGNSICHGDFYPSNIIISGKKLIPIDWSGSYRGDPCGDVARTCLIIGTRAVPPGIPDVVAAMAGYPKWLTYRSYLNEYLKISKVKYEDVDAWMLPVAAAKLKDRIPGEEKWLMGIINKRLEQLEK